MHMVEKLLKNSYKTDRFEVEAYHLYNLHLIMNGKRAGKGRLKQSAGREKLKLDPCIL